MMVEINRYKLSERVRGTPQNEKEYVGGGRWDNHHIYGLTVGCPSRISTEDGAKGRVVNLD